MVNRRNRRSNRGPREGSRRVFSGPNGPRVSVVPERHPTLPQDFSENRSDVTPNPSGYSASALPADNRHQIAHNVIENMGRLARMALGSDTFGSANLITPLKPTIPTSKPKAAPQKPRPRSKASRQTPWRHRATSHKQPYGPNEGGQRHQHVWPRKTRDITLKPTPYQDRHSGPRPKQRDTAAKVVQGKQKSHMDNRAVLKERERVAAKGGEKEARPERQAVDSFKTKSAQREIEARKNDDDDEIPFPVSDNEEEKEEETGKRKTNLFTEITLI
jgi:hypothetical protein